MKAKKNSVDKLIEQIYYKHCSGRQISILDIPPLFRMAREMLAADATQEAIGAAMIARTTKS